MLFFATIQHILIKLISKPKIFFLVVFFLGLNFSGTAQLNFDLGLNGGISSTIPHSNQDSFYSKLGLNISAFSELPFFSNKAILKDLELFLGFSFLGLGYETNYESINKSFISAGLRQKINLNQKLFFSLGAASSFISGYSNRSLNSNEEPRFSTLLANENQFHYYGELGLGLRLTQNFAFQIFYGHDLLSAQPSYFTPGYLNNLSFNVRLSISNPDNIIKYKPAYDHIKNFKTGLLVVMFNTHLPEFYSTMPLNEYDYQLFFSDSSADIKDSMSLYNNRFENYELSIIQAFQENYSFSPVIFMKDTDGQYFRKKEFDKIAWINPNQINVNEYGYNQIYIAYVGKLQTDGFNLTRTGISTLDHNMDVLESNQFPSHSSHFGLNRDLGNQTLLNLVVRKYNQKLFRFLEKSEN